ncbi:MAG TPA: hypothetical protein VNY08_25585 [Bradyrhizobium sp.]|nr:hypothetical protein [Bradyrhizobium sp.]
MPAMKRAGRIRGKDRQQQECDRNGELLHVSPLLFKKIAELISISERL